MTLALGDAIGRGTVVAVSKLLGEGRSPLDLGLGRSRERLRSLWTCSRPKRQLADDHALVAPVSRRPLRAAEVRLGRVGRVLHETAASTGHRVPPCHPSAFLRNPIDRLCRASEFTLL